MSIPIKFSEAKRVKGPDAKGASVFLVVGQLGNDKLPGSDDPAPRVVEGLGSTKEAARKAAEDLLLNPAPVVESKKKEA